MGDAKRGNNAESAFYEELIKADFYQGSTKTASFEGGMSKEAARSMLDSFSADQLEALADEFDNILGKQASSENTLENSILDEGEEKTAEEEEKENSPKDKAEDKAEGESPAEDKKEDSKKKLPPFMMKGKEKEDDKKDDKDDKSEKSEEKEAEELQAQIMKEASDKALVLLEEQGLTLEDYAYSRIQDEKVASFIAEKGEKLAAVMEMNPLLVIDDIVDSIEAQISDAEE
jgi:hypothetical protein